MKREVAFLIEPDARLKTEFLKMAQEYSNAGEDRYQPALEDFDAYLRRLSNASQETNPAAGRVPESIFWLVAAAAAAGDADGRIFGQSRLRHRLNPELEIEGGHIGYDIRPAERNKGYGTLILRLTLGKAKNLGLSGVLLTCDADNIASAKIIEKNGGKLHEQAISQRSGKLISRYRIEF